MDKIQRPIANSAEAKGIRSALFLSPYLLILYSVNELSAVLCRRSVTFSRYFAFRSMVSLLSERVGGFALKGYFSGE
jgi:hypothetical protein